MREIDMDAEEPDVEWLVDGIIMKGGFNVVFAAEKAGKSRFLNYIMLPSIAGVSAPHILGRSNYPAGRTLWCLGEETEAQLVARSKLYAQQQKLGDLKLKGKLFVLEAAGLGFQRPQVQKWLEGKIRKFKIDTLVIDPLRRIHDASENSNDEMSKIFNKFIEWRKSYNLTLVLIHHTGKIGSDVDEDRIANWGRGAGDLASALDWALYMRRYDSKKGEFIRVSRKGRDRPRPDLKIWDRSPDPFRIETLGG